MTATANHKPRRKPAAGVTKPAETKTTINRQRRHTAPLEPEPPVQDEHPRPTHHNGVAVISEQRIPTPVGGFFRISRIALADGTTAHACWECTFTAETRGDIMSHRNAEHGGRVGKFVKTGTPRNVELAELFDLVLPDRTDGSRPGDRAADWTIGEIVVMFPTIKAFGDHLDKVELENEQLREQLKQTRVSRTDQHKLDVYESHQAEIGELRARIVRQGNYEQLRSEVYELRGWKKRIATKLAAVGFQLSEEDQ